MLTSWLGGLAARLDLLKKNLVLSNLAAATGVCFPIGLSYLLLYLGYGYGVLCAVSLYMEVLTGQAPSKPSLSAPLCRLRLWVLIRCSGGPLNEC